MEEITVVIPVNFTDAGRLFGLFEIRNAVEAVLICVPTAAVLMRKLSRTWLRSDRNSRDRAAPSISRTSLSRSTR